MSAHTRNAIVLALVWCVGISIACSPGTTETSTPNVSASHPDKDDRKKRGDKEKGIEEPKAVDGGQAATNLICDKSLWDHVYNPERLIVKNDCVAVTGTITERSTDEDGDEHMLLKLDNGEEELLTKKNKKKKDDDLVIEAVCAGTPKLQKVGDACADFSNPVTLPQVGDHVRVTGSLVLDSHNGWTEIHPISTIEKR